MDERAIRRFEILADAMGASSPGAGGGSGWTNRAAGPATSGRSAGQSWPRDPGASQPGTEPGAGSMTDGAIAGGPCWRRSTPGSTKPCRGPAGRRGPGPRGVGADRTHRSPAVTRERRERMPPGGDAAPGRPLAARLAGEPGTVADLVGAVDDATGDIVGATFRDQEDASGYLLVLDAVVRGQRHPGTTAGAARSVFPVTPPGPPRPAPGRGGRTREGTAGAVLETLGPLGAMTLGHT